MTNPTKRKGSDNDEVAGLTSSSRGNKSSTNNKRVRLAGIRNLGNTCFMNSVLQCLSNLQKFTSSVGDPPGGKSIIESASNGTGLHKRKLMQIANVNDNSKPELLFETLRNTIYLLKKSGKSFIIPESLFTMIGKNSRFRGYQQQDAHEFLRYVLDRLDKECLENRPILEKTIDSRNTLQKNATTTSSNSNRKTIKAAMNHHSTMIGHIFGGILQNEVNCLVCGFKSHKQDPFLDLSLDIPQHQRNHTSASTTNDTSQTNASTTNIKDSSDIRPNSHNSDNSNPSASENTMRDDSSSNDPTTNSKNNNDTLRRAQNDDKDTSMESITTNIPTSNSVNPNANSASNANSNSNSNSNLNSKSNQSTNISNRQKQKQQQSTSDPCHLIDCLSSFIELEELMETELYYCSNCRQKQRSTKRFWIRRLPDVLCLHLKRFRYNNFLRTKIDDYVQFPLQGLDMKRFVLTNKHETRGSSCGPTTYDLVAFIEHHGTGLGSGHYTAYCRHDGYWFHFDDSSVTACDEATIRQSKAYILFYTRRTT